MNSSLQHQIDLVEMTEQLLQPIDVSRILCQQYVAAYQKYNGGFVDFIETETTFIIISKTHATSKKTCIEKQFKKAIPQSLLNDPWYKIRQQTIECVEAVKQTQYSLIKIKLEIAKTDKEQRDLLNEYYQIAKQGYYHSEISIWGGEGDKRMEVQIELYNNRYELEYEFDLPDDQIINFDIQTASERQRIQAEEDRIRKIKDAFDQHPDEVSCVVCYEQFRKSTIYLRCHITHYVCTKCDKKLPQNNRCILCKQIIKPSQIHRRQFEQDMKFMMDHITYLRFHSSRTTSIKESKRVKKMYKKETRRLLRIAQYHTYQKIDQFDQRILVRLYEIIERKVFTQTN